MKTCLRIFLFLALPLFCRAAEDLSPEEILKTGTLISGGSWKATENILQLNKTGKPPETPVRRPANILLLPGKALGAFQLDLEVKSLRLEIKGADVIVVFGYQDELNYYYTHLSNDADNRTHHIIMKVEGAKKQRTPIQLEKDPQPGLNGEWQHLRIIRQQDGKTKVYLDDMTTPTLSTNDDTWLTGRIGIGSFNDPAHFRNLRLTLPDIPLDRR